MALTLTHKFRSLKADGVDSTLVQPSAWNADHDWLMATGKMLGRMTAAAGPVEELPVVVDPTGQSLRLPQGTTAQRPAAPVAGMIRFNTSLGELECYQNGTWGSFADVVASSIPTDTVVGRPHLAGTGLPMAMTKAQIQRLIYNIGSIHPTANGVADSGFILAFGQNLSRTTYADLFQIWGTFYGAGNGSTTFGTPDLRGRALFGADNMGGTGAGRLGNVVGGGLGSTGGLEYHYLTEAQIPSHYHSGSTGGESAEHYHNLTMPAYYGESALAGHLGFSKERYGGGSETALTSGRTAGHYHNFNSNYTGGSSWHSNQPPTFVCNYQIYTGVHT